MKTETPKCTAAIILMCQPRLNFEFIVYSILVLGWILNIVASTELLLYFTVSDTDLIFW